MPHTGGDGVAGAFSAFGALHAMGRKFCKLHSWQQLSQDAWYVRWME